MKEDWVQDDTRQSQAAHAHDQELLQDRDSAFERAYKDWKGLQVILKEGLQVILKTTKISGGATEQDWEQIAYWCGTLDLYKRIK